MIILDGLGGKGEVWVTWKVGTANAVPVPQSILAYCYNTESISPVIPSAWYLPPVSSTTFYDPQLSVYGPRVEKVDIGTIKSVNGDSTTPNPCEQSTVSGTCISLGSGPTTYPRWSVPSTNDPSGVIYYRKDGTRLSFMVGRPAKTSTMKVYDENGELGPVVLSSANTDLWNLNQALYQSCVPLSETSSTRPYARVVHGEVTYSVRPPSEDPVQLFKSQRHTWEHKSANVWVEHWWQAYHHHAGYIPKLPLAFDHYGYVVATIHRKRTHTLVSLQQPSVRNFYGWFNCDEEVDYWGHTASFPIAKYFSSEGTLYGSFSYKAQLEILYPGLCSAPSSDLNVLNDYCRYASERSKVLYKESTMTIARTNAIADVSGLESNWIENLSQVSGTMSVISPLIDGYRAVMSGNPAYARKALAGAYLTYSYAIAPSLSDYQDLTSSLIPTVRNFTKYRFSNERRRGSAFDSVPIFGVTASLAYHCIFHLQLKDNNFSQIWKALESLGLDPTARNGWDLIPFSFVVDWFTNIGSALNAIDLYRSSVLTRNVKSRVQSFKVQWPITEAECASLLPETLQACGVLTYSWYDRRISNRIGKISPFAGQSFDGLSVSQVAQGSALLSNYLD